MLFCYQLGGLPLRILDLIDVDLKGLEVPCAGRTAVISP